MKNKDISTSSRPPSTSLPPGVVKYSQVPKDGGYFSGQKKTIPNGLLRDHNTKAGTWGVIRVHSGKLLYTILGGGGAGGGVDVDDQQQPQHQAAEEYELSPGVDGIVQPTQKHHVTPLTEDVEFCVEFYRLPPPTSRMKV